MPLIRKLIKFGTSRVIVIPSSWLEYIEKQTGEPINKVLVEVNGELKVKPMTADAVEVAKA